MARLTRYEIQIKEELIRQAQEIGFTSYEYDRKDSDVAAEQVHCGKSLEAATKEVVTYIRDYGRKFL